MIFPIIFIVFLMIFPYFEQQSLGISHFPRLPHSQIPKKKRQLRLPWRWSLPHGCRRGNRLERQNWSTGPKDRGNVRISLEKYGTNMEKCGHMINDLEKMRISLEKMQNDGELWNNMEQLWIS
jgi:hypothetical protein